MMTMLMERPDTERAAGVPALLGTRYRMRGAIVRERGVIALTDDGSVLLIVSDGSAITSHCYTAYGESVDARRQHASIPAARDEIVAEYGDPLLAWEDVPEDAGDAHAYAVRVAYDNLTTDYGENRE